MPDLRKGPSGPITVLGAAAALASAVAQSIPSAADTAVVLGTVQVIPTQALSRGVPPNSVTVLQPGFYGVSAWAAWAAVAAGTVVTIRRVRILVNGAPVANVNLGGSGGAAATDATDAMAGTVSLILPFNANDVISLDARQDSGAGLDLSNCALSVWGVFDAPPL